MMKQGGEKTKECDGNCEYCREKYRCELWEGGNIE